MAIRDRYEIKGQVFDELRDFVRIKCSDIIGTGVKIDSIDVKWKESINEIGIKEYEPSVNICFSPREL